MRGNKKGNPNGAGAKKRFFKPRIKTSICIEKNLRDISQENNTNLTADVNKGLEMLYKKNKWI